MYLGAPGGRFSTLPIMSGNLEIQGNIHVELENRKYMMAQFDLRRSKVSEEDLQSYMEIFVWLRNKDKKVNFTKIESITDQC